MGVRDDTRRERWWVDKEGVQMVDRYRGRSRIMRRERWWVDTEGDRDVMRIERWWVEL